VKLRPFLNWDDLVSETNNCHSISFVYYLLWFIYAIFLLRMFLLYFNFNLLCDSQLTELLTIQIFWPWRMRQKCKLVVRAYISHAGLRLDRDVRLPPPVHTSARWTTAVEGHWRLFLTLLSLLVIFSTHLVNVDLYTLIDDISRWMEAVCCTVSAWDYCLTGCDTVYLLKVDVLY